MLLPAVPDRVSGPFPEFAQGDASRAKTHSLHIRSGGRFLAVPAELLAFCAKSIFNILGGWPKMLFPSNGFPLLFKGEGQGEGERARVRVAFT